MRTQVEDLVLSAREIKLDRQLGLRIQSLPSETCNTRIFDNWSVRRCPEGNSRGLQALSGAHDGFPFVRRGRNSQMDGLSLFLSQLERPRKQLLFFRRPVSPSRLSHRRTWP